MPKKEDPIFEILRQQEEALKKKPIFYIHYDPVSFLGVNLRNYLDTTDTLPYIELTENDFDLSDPSFTISNYRIMANEKKLEKIEEKVIPISKIADFIYEIPKIISKDRITYKDRPFDLLIEQNNPLKEFRIKLSKPLKEKFALQGKNNQSMHVYVTALNDPNILYKTLEFTFGELIQHEYYTLSFDDFNGDMANVYALKYFQDYIHVDIRDE